ncbi:short-chain dehydrogenase [Annulohypoxylon truncatum]|uniref:short-chain dehydrogenase n=1 Tax=Annulohypoxylon truncatum TaxID=327061 RepID=UPI002007D67B|nr:short-chain dehydrogenase [Annulohypoxylon truncatum]KAI1214509.1 short-chain dehydrogenase [Annulohypoxylon truncatum]
MASGAKWDPRFAAAGRGVVTDVDHDLTSDEVADKFREYISGKTVVITGCSSQSLGAEAARCIAQHGTKRLILASRSESRMRQVIECIRLSSELACEIIPVEMDLSSQQSVRSAAAEVLKLAPAIDILINSAAACMIPKYTTTPEGIEMTFGTNHIGHFLFTNLLMPALLASANARVVNVTSFGHQFSNVRFDDINFDNGKSYEPFLAYAASKSGNLLFTLGLAMKLGKTNLRAIATDPGSVQTGINRLVTKEESILRGWSLPDGQPNPAIKWTTPAKGVASYIKAAYDPDLANKNGVAITAGGMDQSIAAYALDREGAERLWELSEKLVGQTFEY